MITYIQTDTDSGRSAVKNLRDDLAQAENVLSRLNDSMDTLNRSWEGPANDAMNKRFQEDFQAMQDYCKMLNEMIEQMEQAQTCYENGENKVNDCIQSFQLERA